ncbi:hypothetical protein JGZ19_01750 [Staphylococcus pseudintermedius]|nr:hypothetical protein [Staphylococcus pseudintermedius]MBJ8255691.1 hypothetical protein [Staphylococcus pseudintermedius]MDK3614921.1 hypothetical protein [Staphylococcus pseudintermedius]WQC56740.1 hypothetical protein U0484_06140 [Staphylococcus pseudintermedius]WQC61115.1 hypothetical protein U0486_05410 [Staphylococcus pseudintermedius]
MAGMQCDVASQLLYFVKFVVIFDFEKVFINRLLNRATLSSGLASNKVGLIEV